MQLGRYQIKSMTRMKKNNKFRSAWHALGMPCVLTVFVFLVLREAFIFPLISRYGEQTVAYTLFIHKSIPRRGIPTDIIHYYYMVDGKTYQGHCALSIVDKDSLTVKYIKECPRIHHIHRKNDKY